MDAPELLKKDKVILCGLIILFSIVFLSLALQIKSQWAQDSHWHMSLVENLASGKGYTTDGMSPHGKYPPGLVVLILPFYLILRDINLAGLLVLYMLSIFSIILTYKLSKELFGFKVAILSSLCLIFHNLFIFNSVSIMTETPFMLFSIACIYFFMKSFDKPMFILPSLISLSISILIRYDGLFIIFPLGLYAYFRRSDLKKLFLSKIFLFSLTLSITIVSIWLIRNFIAFGSFLHTDYTQELAFFSIIDFLSFSFLFFKTGYIFPWIALLGICYAFFKLRKDFKVMTILVWIITYILLHSIWSSRAFRFYGEIILVLCIFFALGLVTIVESLCSQKNQRRIILLITLLVIVEQIFIFCSGSINYETSSVNINRYESIHELSSWTNENLPKEAIYIVPDVAVYSIYLHKQNVVYLNQGLSLFIKNYSSQPIYFFTDTLHSWMTKSVVDGIKSGEILLPIDTSQGKAVISLTPEIIKEINYKNKSMAYLFNITNYSIKENSNIVYIYNKPTIVPSNN